MKFKVGDKVKCDSEDWRFYGTVSAVFEHSLCPCYRLSVERMEKEICKFSITQFEFDLEPCEEVDSSENERKREKFELQQKPEKEPQKRKTSDAWDRNLEMYRKEKSDVIRSWAAKNRKDYKTGKLSEEKMAKLREINFPFDVDKKNRLITGETEKEKVETPQKSQKRKRGTWEGNLESYLKGEKGRLINTWMANNRKAYRSGNLSEERFKKLVEINFPFDVAKIKADYWDEQLEEWKKGNRKSKQVKQWKQKSLRRIVEGKLSEDRIAKLKEAGILKS